MTQRAQSVTLIVHGVIIVVLIAAVTALAWEGKIGEQAVVAVISAVLGLVGGSAGTLAVQGFTQAPPNTIKADVTTDTPSTAPTAGTV
jgi:hypothetical protein